MPAYRRIPLAAVALLAAAALAACGDDSSSSSPAPSTAPAGDTSGLVSSGESLVEGCRTDPPASVPEKKTYDAPPPMTVKPGVVYTATLDTSCGTIVVRLDQRSAPATVNNFVFLAREGFYDGLTWHRVSRGFVIQGGDPDGTGSGGPGYEFEDEPPTGANPYPPGAVAMANSGPDTNGSQFFIVTGDASFLPPNYSRFGTVTRGLDAARRIESLAPPDAQPGDPDAEVPRQSAFIHSVTITER